MPKLRPVQARCKHASSTGHHVRRFQVIENTGSRSKAENVNYALTFVMASLGAVVAIFDADHHPVSHHTGPLWRGSSQFAAAHHPGMGASAQDDEHCPTVTDACGRVALSCKHMNRPFSWLTLEATPAMHLHCRLQTPWGTLWRP